MALGASALWGVLSVILSPCHLSSIPLIVGFVSEHGTLTRWRAFGVSTLFALGILITISLIGVVTAATGRMMGDIGGYGNYFVAAVLLVVGLHLIGIVPLPWSGAGQARMKRKGTLAALMLGLLFGIALGPCTFAYMAPILAVGFSLAAKSMVYAVSLLLAYAIGHCAIIVFAGTSAGAVQRYLYWTENSKGTSILRRICGVLVLFGAAYLVYAVR